MKSRRFSFNFILPVLLLAAFASAQAAEKKVFGKGPIVITSASLSADNKANTALFEGSVTAKTEEMTLYSDRMTVYYSDKGAVERINAEGAVRLVKDKQMVTSGSAVYLAAEQKVIFTDKPRAVKDANVVTGTTIVYYIDSDRTAVENSKVFIERSGQ